MKFVRKIKYYYYMLIKGRESPDRIARGFAIGVFVAFNPLLGIHTILCILLSLIFRASKTASILGSLICNPITIPIIYFSEYEIGKYCLKLIHYEVEVKTLADFQNLTLESLIEFGKSIAYPIVIGSIIFGVIFGIIAYIFSKNYFSRVFESSYMDAI